MSTEEQDESKAGLEAQEAAIRAEVAHRGWILLGMRTDVASGKSMRSRDDLGRALRELRDGEADVLVVAKLDRLSRSVRDFVDVMQMARDEGWAILVLDMDVDTTTTNGELIAHIMIALAQWERRVIGDRTRAGLAAIRARGTPLGRKPNVAPETMRLIRVLRESGTSYRQIADALTREGVPTAQGGRWHAGTVQKLHGRVST